MILNVFFVHFHTEILPTPLRKPLSQSHLSGSGSAHVLFYAKKKLGRSCCSHSIHISLFTHPLLNHDDVAYVSASYFWTAEIKTMRRFELTFKAIMKATTFSVCCNGYCSCTNRMQSLHIALEQKQSAF